MQPPKQVFWALPKSLAQEVASRGITVNAVAPGFIDTDMTRAASVMSSARRCWLASRWDAWAPPADYRCKRFCFLCSDSAGYITGETMHVNGGMYMA